MILVQIIILETAGLNSGHDIGKQCHTALGCFGLVLIINQNIWKETFEDIVDAIIEALSQDYLDTESSRSVARHHDDPSCHSSVSRSRSPVYSLQLPMITLFTHLKVVPRFHDIESSPAVCVVYGNAFQQQCTSPALSIKDEKGSWFY